MGPRKGKKQVVAEVVEEEKLLYTMPKIEKVISDSPQLEDDVDPVLDPEHEHQATLAFHTKQDPGARLERAHLKGVFVEMNMRLQDEQFVRLVEKHPVFATIQWDADDKIDIGEWLRLFTAIYAPATRYGARLRRAAGRGEVERMRDYHARGCDLRGTDGLGYTATHCAAAFDQLEVLNFLLAPEVLGHHAVDVRDKAGWTPFLCAAAAGHARVLARLADAGADVHAATVHGRGALHWAAAKGRGECLKFLLGKGARPDDADKAGMTAVHLAAQHGHLAACALLLGADEKPLTRENTIGVKPTDYQDVVFWSKVTDALPASKLK